jgi:WD40 repeat protein
VVRLAGHKAIVTGVAFHPRGKVLASCSDDRTVRLWAVRPDPALPVLPGLPSLRCVAFGFGGERVAGANPGSGDLHSWGLRTGEEERAAGPVPFGRVAVAFSPDGTRVVLAGPSGQVSVRDLDSGEELFRLPSLGSVAFPAGQAPWEAAAFAAGVRTVPHPAGEVAWSPEGKYIATGGGRTVSLWDARSGLLLRRWSFDGQLVTGLRFVAGAGRLVASDGTGRFQAWDPATGEPDPEAATPGTLPATAYLQVRTPDGGRFATVAWSRWGRAFAVQDRATRREVARLDAIGLPLGVPPPPNPLAALAGLRLDALADVRNFLPVAFSADGRLLALAAYTSVRVWDTGSGRLLPPLALPPRTAAGAWPTYGYQQLPAVGFSPGSDRVAVGYADGRVGVWDLAGGGRPPWRTWDGNRQAVVSVTFSPDGDRLLVVGADGTAVLRSLGDAKRNPTFLLRGPRPIVDLALSRDGNKVVTLDEGGTVRVWDRTTRSIAHEMTAEIAVVPAAAPTNRSNWIAPDAAANRVATVGYDHSVRVAELTTGRVLCVIPPVEKADPIVYSVALSPDGNWLATGGPTWPRRSGSTS